MYFSLIFLMSGIVFGGACAIVATNKNRDGLGWFVLGFLFSLVALIVIASLSPVAKQARSRAGNRSRSTGGGEFISNPQDPERPWLG